MTRAAELQSEINRLAAGLGVEPMTVGKPTRKDDDLNIFVDDDGTYHYTYHERGQLGFDRAGSLDDVLYWYCEGVVSSAARFEDRKDRFLFEYQVLRHYNPEWGKRLVRELATNFRDWGKPQDIALLPDIGEPV
jgi:hypothetical protein